MTDAYKVILDRKECQHCDTATLWSIEGPDGVMIGTSWPGGEGKEQAEDIVDLMNMAFDAGVESAAQEKPE